jgi:DNA-binding SARP family transcriptional activator
MLVAPAGYGKTTLANSIRAEYANSASCDCDCEDVKTFAHNVLLALQAENPNEASFFSGLLVQLSSIEQDAECRNILTAAWCKESPASVFVFDNTEAIARDSNLLASLTDLLNTAPVGRRVIVCSRTPLPTRASRYLPPHRLSKLSTQDLRLSDGEAAPLLQQQGVPPEYRERIIAVARGWPVVLLLLARLFREGRLEAALSDANNIAFEDLFVYFVHEVLAPLDAAVKHVMTLCSVVPDVTADELCIATGQTPLELQDTLRKSLLVQREGDTFTIHPLVREVLLQTQSEAAIPVSIAEYAEQRADCRRAALLYRLVGKDQDAARAMARLSMQELQKAESAYELTQLPLQALRVHPKLIAVAEQLRSDITSELLCETFERLSEDDDPVAIVAAAQAHSDHLDLQQGLAVIESPLVRRAAQVSSDANVLLAGWPETLKAYFWKFSGVEESLCNGYARLNEAGLPMHSARMAHYLENTLRLRGDREGSLHWQAVCVEHARHLGPRPHAHFLFLSLYCAWFWNEEQAAKEHHSELEAAASATHHPDYAWVLHALQADSVDSLVPLWEPGLLLRQILMAAAKVSGGRRDALVEYGFKQLGSVDRARAFLTLVQAVSDPPARRQWCEELLETLDMDEAPEMRNAILACAQGRPSFLQTFTSHFEQKKGAAASVATALRLEVLNEQILIDGKPIRLTTREAAVLAFLSRRRIATPREEIQDAIWPDLEETGARDALYSLLHRLRKRTMRADIVEGIGNAYRLTERVQVDLWELEFISQQLQRGAAVDAAVDLPTLYSRVQRREYPHLRQYEWFAPIEYRVNESARVLARHLIGAAKKAGDDAAILRYAADLIEEDPCDEWAHETLIRLHLENDNRAEAARAYRNYRQLLEQQLGAAPSTEMQQLAKRLNA